MKNNNLVFWGVLFFLLLSISLFQYNFGLTGNAVNIPDELKVTVQVLGPLPITNIINSETCSASNPQGCVLYVNLESGLQYNISLHNDYDWKIEYFEINKPGSLGTDLVQEKTCNFRSCSILFSPQETNEYFIEFDSKYYPNVAPTNPTASISQSSPDSTNNLNCSFTYQDSNSDIGTATIIWYNNSIEHFRTDLSSITVSSIGSYNLLSNSTNSFLANQKWTCAVKVNDGTVDSSWSNSSVTIQNTPQANYPPNNPTPSIDPITAYRNSSLRASSLILDSNKDNLTVEIVWWNNTNVHLRKNLTNLNNGSNASYILLYNVTNNFTINENWTVSFRAFDGNISSDWTNDSVIIINFSSVAQSVASQTPSANVSNSASGGKSNSNSPAISPSTLSKASEKVLGKSESANNLSEENKSTSIEERDLGLGSSKKSLSEKINLLFKKIKSFLCKVSFGKLLCSS